MDKSTFKMVLVLSCAFIIIFTVILAYTSNDPLYQYMASFYNIQKNKDSDPKITETSITPIKNSDPKITKTSKTPIKNSDPKITKTSKTPIKNSDPKITEASITPIKNSDQKITEASITPIKDSDHFMVSAFIDHRLNGVIRVISIIKRNSLQPLYCIYCNTEQECRTVQADVQIHSDHFGFPLHVSDVICKGKNMQSATHVLISTKDSDNNDTKYLPVKNRIRTNTFKFDFTICISNLFGDYNNVLQFVQTMEMYKLLGVQHVVIYKTSCGPDLEKLLKHYEMEGMLEIVSWPIDKFLNPSPGWNFQEHKGDVHYYGQLITLNECIYRHMYQSKYVLLNDIDEIIMPYKYTNLPSLMEDLQSAHPRVGVFLIENHIFPKTQFEDSGKFKRAEWNNIPGVNIMEHIYREPDRKNVYNPTKMIVNPRKVEQTSVHSSLKNYGDVYHVPFDVCRIVHVRVPLQGHLTKDQLFEDKKVWDFQQELIPNVDQTLNSSGLLRPYSVL